MAVVSLDVNHRRTPYVSFPDTTSDVTYFSFSFFFSRSARTHTLSRQKNWAEAFFFFFFFPSPSPVSFSGSGAAVVGDMMVDFEADFEFEYHRS